MMPLQSRVRVAVGVGFIALVLANIASLHFRSGGLLVGLGLQPGFHDSVRAWGFPFEVWHRGGFQYSEGYSVLGVLGNVLVWLGVIWGLAHLARQPFQHRQLRCPQCGYDLKGSTSDRCPECGQPATV